MRACAVEAMANDSRGQDRRDGWGRKKEQPKINSTRFLKLLVRAFPDYETQGSHVIDVKRKKNRIFRSIGFHFLERYFSYGLRRLFLG